MKDFIAVARLVRTRGIKGELVAESLTSHPEQLPELKSVFLDKGATRHKINVARVWFHDGRPVFQFEGIPSMTEAEAWVGAEVQIPADERMQLEEGEYYFSDLIGCQVVRFVSEGVSGETIGVVKDVDEMPGRAMLVVVNTEREMLIPLVKAICREIDVNARIIRVDPPEGLLELAD